MDDLLSCGVALQMVLQHAARLPVLRVVEMVSLERAQGRVVAHHILADRDQPPFDRSTRDGFALSAASAAATLRIVGSLRAGEVWSGPAIRSEECVEIMTGAPLPPGANCVAMVEHVEHPAEGQVRLHESRGVSPGENVVEQGSEARADDVLIQPGTRLGAPELALAASLGCAQVEAFARPEVCVLATGDELVRVDETPLPHQIRNSNSYGIAALCHEAGGQPRTPAPVADDLGALERALDEASDADLLVLSGGVSAGKYDFVETALANRGAEFFFTGVKMQPGKPLVFGRLPATATRREQYLFGLPGNPISTQVTFRLFVNPLLRALGGESNPVPQFVQGTLAHEVRVKHGLMRFLPAVLGSSLGNTSVTLTGWQGSGDLAANARSNCYAVIPPDVEKFAAGSVVQVLLR